MAYFFKIRSSNSFRMVSNWSEAVMVEVPNGGGSVQPPTTSSPSSKPAGFAAWVYVAIGLAGVLVILGLTVIFCCVYKRYCFHRNIKFVSTNTEDSFESKKKYFFKGRVFFSWGKCTYFCCQLGIFKICSS